jgi:holo-[acyl-carrier protein] synthase
MSGLDAYSIGIDVERAGRFDHAGEDPTLQALFTLEERRFCAGAPDVAATYAGTWCAKEAVVKALAPWVVIDPRRVTVQRAADGSRIAISDWDGGGRGVTVRVSIADRRPMATAVAFATGPTRDDDGDGP